MFLGCCGEASRPITLPSNWQSPVINFALVSVYVSSSPLQVSLPFFLSNLVVRQRISSPPVCLRLCLLNNGQRVKTRAKGGMERGETNEKDLKGCGWVTDSAYKFNNRVTGKQETGLQQR